MTGVFSSLIDFDQFLTDHAKLAPGQWNPVKRDAFAAACLDRLASSAVWEFGTRQADSWETILAAGLEMPVAIAATMVAMGNHRLLVAWRAHHPAQVSDISAAAAHPVFHGSDSDQWQPALHTLVSAASEASDRMTSLAEVLALGVDVHVVDSEGMPALGAASDLAAVELLMAAGANPNHMVAGRHVLDKALSVGHFYASNQSIWRKGWSELLSSLESPSIRPTLAFVLARSGRTDLLEDLVSHWGWSPQDRDRIRQQMDSRTGPREWTWTGWVGYHAVLGIRQGCEKELQESLARLGPEGVAALPEWDRMWLAVAVHLNQHSGTGNRLGASKARWSVSEPVLEVLEDKALMDWAHARLDLPLTSGGLIRYRALREWLVEGLVSRLESKQMTAPAWALLERFVLEDIKGEERMNTSDYKKLRELVLAAALETSPQGSFAPPLPLVVLSLVRCLEHASAASPASLPKLGSVFSREKEPFASWVGVDFSSVSWPSPIRQAVIEGHARLDVVDLEKMFAGTPEGQKWSGVTHALGARVQAAHLESTLPSPALDPIPARRPSARI